MILPTRPSLTDGKVVPFLEEGYLLGRFVGKVKGLKPFLFFFASSLSLGCGSSTSLTDSLLSSPSPYHVDASRNRRFQSPHLRRRYTGTLLFQKGKLSELIGELQALVKGLEKGGKKQDGDSDYSDPVAQQVKRLAMEVRQLASSRQITVLNANSGQMGNLSGLLVPAAVLGTLGYGYMWWKGIKFSDLMYVSKRSVATAVSSLTRNLEQVSDAISAAKMHLRQRIQHVDDIVETQKEISKAIQKDVNNASENIAQIGEDVSLLRFTVDKLDGHVNILEQKQDAGLRALMYICQTLRGRKWKFPEALEDELKPSGRTHISITYSKVPTLMGLKELADDSFETISEPETDMPNTNGILSD